MSTTMFNRRKANANTGNDQKGGIRHRIIMATITDEDTLSESNSTEPSLANSSISNLSSSSRSLSRQHSTPFHSIPIHSNTSLLDMTRDDSHDDDNNDSLDVSGPRDANYRSPDTSLLDDDEDEEEGDAVTVMGKSLANISASLSGSFCTNGNEVTNSCAMSDCTSYISDKKKVLFSDTILKERIMTDFNYILGSTTAPCCSEKNLFTDCFGMEQSEAPVEMSVETKIRNRAGESWRARAYRIKRLREERMIQDSSLVPKSGNLLMENGLQLEDNGMMRSTSFSHQKSKASKPRSMKPKEVNVEPLGCMIGNCIEPISPLEEGNDLDVEWKSRQEYIDEQDLCYDSDPGINSHRTEHEEVAVVTSDSERMALSHGRSKSDTALTQPQAPKKKWFKSPGKRRRRKMHYDSFDESLDKGKTNIGTERDEALDLIRDDFYGNGSPSSDSFDEPPPPYKSGSIGKRANTIHIDKEIRRNVQVRPAHLQFLLELHVLSSHLTLVVCSNL
jgi:hypothetical protein